MPGEGGGVVSNTTGFDAFDPVEVADLCVSLLLGDRLTFLLGRSTSSSDDEFERECFGDMLLLGVLLLLLFVADLFDRGFEEGMCIPREGRDSDLRRVSYGMVLRGSEGS